MVYVAHPMFRSDYESQFRALTVACMSQDRLHAGLLQCRMEVTRCAVCNVQCLYREEPTHTRHAGGAKSSAKMLDHAAQTAPQFVTGS